jgi:branched-chain amino acid transport system substrate-binding protein
VIMLDDATDPTKGVQNAKRFVSEDKVDIMMGSVATPVAIAMAGTVAEAQTCSLACSPPPCCRPARTPGPSACRSPTP